jgi:hypothetical protein
MTPTRPGGRASGPAPRRSDAFARDAVRGSRTTGLALRNSLEHLQRVATAEERDAIMDALPEADRELLRHPGEHEEVPYAVALRLWRSTERVLAQRDPQWMERMGVAAVQAIDVQLGADLVRRDAPLGFLTRQIPLFRLYYRPGDMILIDHGPGHAVVRLVGFDPEDPLFCRRFTGAWDAAVRMNGGRDVTVRHLRCTCEGDMFCEWLLRWTE